MPSFFSRLKAKEGPTKPAKSKKNAAQNNVQEVAPKPVWEDAWTRKTVEPEEVQELLRGCTLELKSRALDMPFMLLPFRPTSDPSAARSFIRNFFDRGQAIRGDYLIQELRLTEPMVLCSVVKWCWARLPGGVVSWDAYELFRVGEQDSNMARDSFSTFIPLSVDSDARTKIIFDFFDLLAAIAAHGKTNGLGGRKLSRLAAWWAFEHQDTAKGFEGGYKGWASAADATSHLFFAYLRSQSPESIKGLNGISTLSISLQKLLQETEYPPQTPSLMQTSTTKVIMIVNTVSPTPFALLRRANHFQYRDDDRALQQFSDYDDPVKALTDECRRVLKSISAANQSQVSNRKQSTSVRDASWSRFEDIGFSGAFDETEEDEDSEGNYMKPKKTQGLRNIPHSQTADGGRPTTPSWADFMSSGFVDEVTNNPTPLLLPPDKILPPIDISRGRSSQSHRPRMESENDLDPGELANITRFDLDDAFWWVWISSLAGEEPADRKAAFGRCALIETVIPGGKWLVLEEVVKGAAAEPAGGAYIAEKKSRFGWTRRSKGSGRRKSTGKRDGELDGSQNIYKGTQSVGVSKTSIGPDQHARIQAAAAQLQQRQRQQESMQRRGRQEVDVASQKTNSVMTLQPVIMKEASPAMQWAHKYDKAAIREAYLANDSTGKGLRQMNGNGFHDGDLTPGASVLGRNPSTTERDLPKIPAESRSELRETPPVVPSKQQAPPPAPMPPTPAALEVAQERYVSEKAAEVALPADLHPVERTQTETQNDVTPRIEPSFDEPPRVEESRDLLTPEPKNYKPTGPESPKQNKLQKKAVKDETRGFRKMFGRNKNRNSKLPENATTTLNENQFDAQKNGQLQAGGATIGRRFSGFKKNSSNAPTDESSVVAPPEANREEETTPVQSPQQMPMSYEPSLRDDSSRIDTADQHEANQAFSNFDQGPLEDMPAFAPGSASIQDSEADDSAAPPVATTKEVPASELNLAPTRAPLSDQAPKQTPAQTRYQAPVRAPVQTSAQNQAQASAPAPVLNPALAAARAAARAAAPGSGPAQTPIKAPVPVRAPAAAFVPSGQPVQSAVNPLVQPTDQASAPAQAQNGAEPPTAHVQDRWAQIRKNAAERAAQRQTDEQSKGGLVTQTPIATDENDVETSGEETIESRVARIKARVAELTGNMDNSGASPGNRNPAQNRWQ